MRFVFKGLISEVKTEHPTNAVAAGDESHNAESHLPR
jgi:hypothetical protein